MFVYPNAQGLLDRVPRKFQETWPLRECRGENMPRFYVLYSREET